ncbi:MAG: methyltransferase [Roseiflexaceae bacterium]
MTLTLDTPVAAPAVAPAAPQQLWQLIMGCFSSQTIHVAAKLRIPDLLKDGPRSALELADATGTNPQALYRVLRALAGIGVFAEDDDGRFGLTPLAELLRTDVPGSMHAAGLLIGSILQWPALGDMLYSVQTGRPSFDHLFGVTQWQYMKEHPEEYELFHYAMSSFSAAEIKAILAAYDFGAANTVVDIAGGQGRLLAAVLQAHPHLRGTLFELSEIAEQAKATFAAAGVAERCTLLSGNMFSYIPAKGDLYMMKTVIHDWNDQEVEQLLRVCYAAMPTGTKLLVITRVVAPGNVPDSSKFMDLNMMITMGGSERTAAEIERLLTVAGLSLQRIIPTRSPLSIVESVKL